MAGIGGVIDVWKLPVPSLFQSQAVVFWGGQCNVMKLCFLIHQLSGKRGVQLAGMSSASNENQTMGSTVDVIETGTFANRRLCL